MSLRERITALGWVLPETPRPKGDYVPVTIHAGVAYVSGQVCRVGEGVISGPLTDQTPPQTVLHAGQTCALRALSVLDQAVGLENIERILFVRGFVYGGEGFQNFSKVVDGASQVLIDVFGECGRHARSAVGVAGLPSGGLLELEVVAAVKPNA
ncbi:RidA family protein [Pseudomonas sp. BIGb0164]|uniref:RidA family protein n=1 Tax=Pseudomonas sp. BIGb0164 TaxID=2940605 RepID=UPI002169A576|nr:RidA family protein [Pseudomonas sp. BIGb0164]MCS4249929.1 enamine deaminase RidA (YjgF/YER057c/UK114 family) [Pseudomonas sp. BIGb0164]